ncbi:MAG: sulfatase-like hydrolase/transferase, partial [Oscillospiraceae bacterium]|nr:sulfatase-like hydrolase/transferase [Oscillospiraceae bacterium]
KSLYTGEYLAMRSVRVFGVQTAACLDARTLLFGTLIEAEIPVETIPEEPEPEEPTEVKEIPVPVIYNEMPFDFETLAAEEQNKNISALHSYFVSQQPTNQNDYTGLFKGKNLVLVTAEGWSPYAVSEEITPTLYKMLNEGFVFEKFYNPIWGVSTTDGEYAACMGLIPKKGVWSFYHSHDNYMPLCMGKQMTSLGYTAKAYHNHFFDYYSRHLSHPNMGYDYKGYGNGLDITYIWPESDEEMIHITVDEYIDSEPFIAYYMTVSGHLAYTFSGNNMARAHRDVVDHLELSDDAKAYIACNYELELAMTELLTRLEDKGIADDTVFCIVPDHYPYGLLEETQNELAGHTVDRNFEIYKSCLVIWSPSMQEPVYVTAPASPLDIVPTLSNLFGLEYDSRLLVGRDALSDASPLVVFNNRSWMTELGRYNADRDEFTPNVTGSEIPEGYVESMCARVDAKFTVSEKILDTDYYRVLWEKSGLEVK